MTNVVPFPNSPKTPSEIEMEVFSLSPEDVFSVIMGVKTMDDFRWERLNKQRLDELRAFSVADLRRFWDELNEADYYEGPEGSFDISDIHRALNEKGDGRYCAV